MWQHFGWRSRTSSNCLLSRCVKHGRISRRDHFVPFVAAYGGSMQTTGRSASDLAFSKT